MIKKTDFIPKQSIYNTDKQSYEKKVVKTRCLPTIYTAFLNSTENVMGFIAILVNVGNKNKENDNYPSNANQL